MKRKRLFTRKPCAPCGHLLHHFVGAGCYAEDNEGARFCDCASEHRVDRQPRHKTKRMVEAWAVEFPGEEHIGPTLFHKEPKHLPPGVRAQRLVPADPLAAVVVKAARAYFQPHEARADSDPVLDRLRVAMKRLEKRK